MDEREQRSLPSADVRCCSGSGLRMLAHSHPPTDEAFLGALCLLRRRREFEIWRYAPPAGTAEVLPAARGPLLLLLQRGTLRLRCGGQTRELRRGDVYFVGAGHALEVQASADATAWLAACNGMAFA